MNAVEIKNLRLPFFKYKKGEGINLNVPKGCVVGLVGRNGSGKTTLLKHINGFYGRYTSNTSVLGVDASCRDFYKLKNDIGIVCDSNILPHSYDCCMIDSLMSELYDNWDSKKFFDYVKRIEEASDDDDDEDIIGENNVRTPLVKKEIHRLSKGMVMKVNIAVALSHAPKLLVLDEPTGGLDVNAREEIVEMLREFMADGEHSIIITSHITTDLEKLCDYIAFIDKGKILLFDEKDKMTEKYCTVICNNEELGRIEPLAIKRIKSNEYSNEVIILKGYLPDGMEGHPVFLEDVISMLMNDDNKPDVSNEEEV